MGGSVYGKWRRAMLEAYKRMCPSRDLMRVAQHWSEASMEIVTSKVFELLHNFQLELKRLGGSKGSLGEPRLHQIAELRRPFRGRDDTTTQLPPDNKRVQGRISSARLTYGLEAAARCGRPGSPWPDPPASSSRLAGRRHAALQLSSRQMDTEKTYVEAVDLGGRRRRGVDLRPVHGVGLLCTAARGLRRRLPALGLRLAAAPVVPSFSSSPLCSFFSGVAARTGENRADRTVRCDAGCERPVISGKCARARCGHPNNGGVEWPSGHAGQAAGEHFNFRGRCASCVSCRHGDGRPAGLSSFSRGQWGKRSQGRIAMAKERDETSAAVERKKEEEQDPAGGLLTISYIYGSFQCYFGINLRPLCDLSEVSYTNMAYFEFLPMEDNIALVELAGMEAGREYELVVSNYAGFRRYRIGDVLRVTGFHNVPPQFRYVRRRNVVLYVGVEKTGEAELQPAARRCRAGLLRGTVPRGPRMERRTPEPPKMKIRRAEVGEARQVGDLPGRGDGGRRG
nr:unnamed protein product [Digitaria exilis]